MMDPERKLNEMGITLGEVAPAAGAYVPAVRTGNLLFVSGQLPWRDGKIACIGKVGPQDDLTQAQEAARLAAISALAVIKAELGSLGAVRRIVRVEVFVNSAAGFTDQAQVANGASLFLHEVFGPAGQHARLAVGVAELPLNASVEISFVVEVS